jgi:hypothetical protein
MDTIKLANVPYPCLSATGPVMTANTQNPIPISNHCDHFTFDEIIAYLSTRACLGRITTLPAYRVVAVTLLRVRPLRHAKQNLF